MREKRRKSRFGLGLLIYILVFVLLAVVALAAFRQYLAAYEASRVTTALRSFMDENANGKLSYDWGAALGGVNAGPAGGNDVRHWAQDKLRTATVREQLGSASDEKTYHLYDEDGICFETVTLRQTKEGAWGFTGWEITGEEIHLEPYTTTVSVTVPESYTVEVGGAALDSSFVAESGICFELLKPFREDITNLPVLSRYEYGPVLGAGAVTILDSAGQPVPEAQQNEYAYLDSCSAADRARIQDFVNRWLEAYLPYADDLNGAGMGYFYQVYSLIITGGDLETMIRRASDGFEYGNVQMLEILSTDIDCATDLGDGQYFVDFSYHIRTYGLSDPTEEDYHMRLLLRDLDGTLYAEQMYLS